MDNEQATWIGEQASLPDKCERCGRPLRRKVQLPLTGEVVVQEIPHARGELDSDCCADCDEDIIEACREYHEE